MKVLARALLALVLFQPALAHAEATAESRAEALRLLEVLNMQVAMEKMTTLTLDAEIESKPELEPYRGVMLAFFHKYMSYETLKPQLAEIYADAFTARELVEIRAWYSSPTGHKALEIMPSLMQSGADIGRKQMEGHMDELVKMLREEKERIEAAKPAADKPDTKVPGTGSKASTRPAD